MPPLRHITLPLYFTRAPAAFALGVLLHSLPLHTPQRHVTSHSFAVALRHARYIVICAATLYRPSCPSSSGCLIIHRSFNYHWSYHLYYYDLRRRLPSPLFAHAIVIKNTGVTTSLLPSPYRQHHRLHTICRQHVHHFRHCLSVVTGRPVIMLAMNVATHTPGHIVTSFARRHHARYPASSVYFATSFAVRQIVCAAARYKRLLLHAI